MFIILIRTLILYFIVIVSMRLMGKKQIGELEPFELVITIMISELASLPMQDNRIPILHGIVPIIILLMIQTSISLLQLKSEKLRGLLNGEPTILIKHGEISLKELRNQRFNINDLMEELRLQGYYDIQDIEFAILETSGQLSIMARPEKSPIIKEDLDINTKNPSIPITLILDGKVNKFNLTLIHKDENWLLNKLKENSIDSFDEVLVASLDSNKKFYYQKK